MTDNTLSTDTQAALAVVQGDAIKAFWPVVQGLLNNIKANGSVSNLTAEGLIALPALTAALPTLEQNVAQDLAGLVETDLQSFVTNLTPVATPST